MYTECLNLEHMGNGVLVSVDDREGAVLWILGLGLAILSVWASIGDCCARGQRALES